MKRPPVVAILSVLQFVGAAIWLLIVTISALGLLFAGSPPAHPALAAVILSFFLVAGVLQFFCGYGLWTLKPYGRWLQIALACVGLIGIPVGTIIGALILVYMNKPGVKLVFSGRPADSLDAAELASIAAVSTGSAIIMGVAVVGVLILLVPVAGIVAAIAIPGLLRARMTANEAVAINTLTMFGRAEALYARGNGGYFDRSACLVGPHDCNPSFARGSFLAEAPHERAGYRFIFLEGVPPQPLPQDVSRSSMIEYVLFAEPIAPNTTGRRLFCVDGSGAVRGALIGSAHLSASQRTCPVEWTEVR